MKKALITGITGQDGSYLAELLLEKGYEVHGVMRRSSSFNTERIDHIYQDPHQSGAHLRLHYGDMTDGSSLRKIIDAAQPDEVYHLAAQSHVRVSFDMPEYTGDVTGLGTIRFLEALRDANVSAKFYQASSSEMFGNPPALPITELTPLHPRSPYGCAKVFSYWLARNYRESYNMFTVNGILFNHESPRRGPTFVTRKITRGLARIKLGKEDKLFLGNLDARRDWGFAKDYVEAMWRMLQQPEPDDYVIATNETHSVREFCEVACTYFGYTLEWIGKGAEERGVDTRTGKVLIQVDPRYYRPAEIDTLLGDYSKAQRLLGWEPTTRFQQLVMLMADADLAREQHGTYLQTR
jgi:GDPmannose 4,6-dehydratase